MTTEIAFIVTDETAEELENVPDEVISRALTQAAAELVQGAENDYAISSKQDELRSKMLYLALLSLTTPRSFLRLERSRTKEVGN